MEYIFALVLSGLTTIIYFYFKNKKMIQIKPKVIKKEELIENYRLELFKILEKYEGNNELQLEEKLKFLKKVNYELSMNIFFEKEEAKNLIQELSNLRK
jgi:hypothetical protein